MPPTDWSITLDTPDPSFGGTVSFTVVEGKYPGNAQSMTAWVQNTAHQGEKLVYAEWHGFFPGYYAGADPNFTLGPTPSWSGGAAQGVAQLGYWSRSGGFRVMDELEYEIAG